MPFCCVLFRAGFSVTALSARLVPPRAQPVGVRGAVSAQTARQDTCCRAPSATPPALMAITPTRESVGPATTTATPATVCWEAVTLEHGNSLISFVACQYNMPVQS